MTNLYFFHETFTNGINYSSLTIISAVAVLCGVLVITSKNPIVSVLYLIGLFFSIAMYLMMLGIHFIGLSYLLVYVGAVSILFLFILMLINVRISELVTDNSNGIPLAVMIGIIFSLTLYQLFPSQAGSYPLLGKYLNGTNEYSANNKLFSENMTSSLDWNTSENGNMSYMSSIFKETHFGNDLYLATTSSWDGALSEFSHITTIGNVIYTVYPIWLIITSLILLLAMVGAIVITIKQ